MLRGCITALVTPFRSGRLDVQGLKRNVEFQLGAGVTGVLVCGSTGEAPTLSAREWRQAVLTAKAALERGGGRNVHLVVGVGTNSTTKTLRQARIAQRLGANSLLVVAPYYNRPGQEGIYRHFRAVAEAVSIPVIVYNIPSRSVVNISPATIERLAKDCPNILAVKEASGSLDQVSETIARCGDRVTILSGDDSLTLPMMALGAQGVISVVSNIVPGDVQRMVEAMLRGRSAVARRLHFRLFPLAKAMFVETNPAPVKAAMEMLGMPAGKPRLPLTEPSAESCCVIRRAMLDYGLAVGES